MSHLLPRAARQFIQFNSPSRLFSTSIITASGHSRWSKIKHDKGKADARKGQSREELSKAIARVSKDGGSDPVLNPGLAPLIAAAKRTGMPKSGIEAAIARGQGFSATGKPLESINVEFLFPDSNIAGILECQTDNKRRLIQTVNDYLKMSGATNTSVTFMFDRKGKITFAKQPAWDEETLMDQAIEAGASDMDVEEDEIVLITEVAELAAVAEAMSEALGAKPKSQDPVWMPKDDLVIDGDSITPEAQGKLDKLFDYLEDEQSVQETYLNIA